MSNFFCQGCGTVLYSRIDYACIDGLPYCPHCYDARNTMPCLCVKCQQPCDCNEMHCARCLADAIKEEEAKAGQPAADVITQD